MLETRLYLSEIATMCSHEHKNSVRSQIECEHIILTTYAIYKGNVLMAIAISQNLTAAKLPSWDILILLNNLKPFV